MHWVHYIAHAPEKKVLAHISDSIELVELEKVQLMPKSKRSRVANKSKVNLKLFALSRVKVNIQQVKALT